MKSYKVGIILGIVSILCYLLFIGISIGFNNVMEIISTAFCSWFSCNTILGICSKNDKARLFSSVINK